jgi:hypothetical protein
MEGIGQTVPETISEARERLFSFIEGFYKTKRLHLTLGYRTPNEVEKEILVNMKLDKKSRTEQPD